MITQTPKDGQGITGKITSWWGGFSLGLMVLALAFVIPAAPSFSQSAPAALDQGLSFVISCAKSNWLFGEPVPVRLAFTNPCSTEKAVTTTLRLGAAAAYMVSEDGTNFERVKPVMFIDAGWDRTRLAPGESFYHEEILCFDGRPRGLVFPRPGRYSVRVDVDGIQSNVLIIGVVEPVSEIDKKWSVTFRRPEVALAASRPGFWGTKTAEALAGCPQQPGTFSPYAAFLLATRGTNRLEAIALLEKADIIGFPLQSQAIYERARRLLELGRQPEALEGFKRVVREFPDSAAAWGVKANGLLAVKQPDATAQEPKPPREAFNQITRQLEAEGYDWKGFMRESSPPASEYRRKELEIFDAYSQTGTPPEAYKKIGELLETYVKKYVVPIPAEELKRRYESAAKQEAEELARRQAEKSGRIPEVQKPPREKAGKPAPK
jgi:hypothetical protein